jgi:serine/threonine protein kinase
MEGGTAVSREGRLGKYEIVHKLAQGGMAEIYLARVAGVEGFEKYVVIKKVLPELAANPRFVQMLLDEARIAAELHHPHIGQIYELGVDGGVHFFAMEYLHGEDLRAILKAASGRRERVPLAHAVTILSGVAAALHYAHERVAPDGTPLTIVHRDVSPSNIVITYDGTPKLVDFGIARARTRTAETRTGQIKGKLAYMSPEQCLGETVDPRSDIFSLGIVVWELSTGRRLFRRSGDSDYVVMNRIVNAEVPRPSTLVAGYPAALESIVMTALARDPDERYATAADLLGDLEDFARQQKLVTSSVALRNYLRDLVGERPEPWRLDPTTRIEIADLDEESSFDDAWSVEVAGSAASEKEPSVAAPLPPPPKVGSDAAVDDDAFEVATVPVGSVPALGEHEADGAFEVATVPVGSVPELGVLESDGAFEVATVPVGSVPALGEHEADGAFEVATVPVGSVPELGVHEPDDPFEVATGLTGERALLDETLGTGEIVVDLDDLDLDTIDRAPDPALDRAPAALPSPSPEGGDDGATVEEAVTTQEEAVLSLVPAWRGNAPRWAAVIAALAAALGIAYMLYSRAARGPSAAQPAAAQPSAAPGDASEVAPVSAVEVPDAAAALAPDPAPDPAPHPAPALPEVEVAAPATEPTAPRRRQAKGEPRRPAPPRPPDVAPPAPPPPSDERWDIDSPLPPSTRPR